MTAALFSIEKNATADQSSSVLKSQKSVSKVAFPTIFLLLVIKF